MLEASLSKYPERRIELDALRINWSESGDLIGEKLNASKRRAAVSQADFEVYMNEMASFGY